MLYYISVGMFQLQKVNVVGLHPRLKVFEKKNPWDPSNEPTDPMEN